MTHVSDEIARRARVFGQVARRYQRVRPDYPAELVDDVVSYAGGPATVALEVGAGTGKATVPFAERGLTVTAVEPDAAMAEVLRDRLAGNPLVTIDVRAFEEHEAARPYGLLYSAQAWHWTDPDTRWQRAADLLAPGAALALFWNGDRIADADLRAAVLAAHQEYAPEALLEEEHVPEDRLAEHWPGTDLVANPAFGDRAERLYQWERTMSMDDFVAVLSTQSSYRILEQPARHALFDAIRPLATEVRLAMETVLYLARRT